MAVTGDHTITYKFTSIYGGPTLAELPLKGPTWTRLINGAGPWQATLPDDPKLRTINEIGATEPNLTAMWVDIDGVLVYGGGTEWRGYSMKNNELLSLRGSDFLSYASKRLQAKDYSTVWATNSTSTAEIAYTVLNDIFQVKPILDGIAANVLNNVSIVPLTPTYTNRIPDPSFEYDIPGSPPSTALWGSATLTSTGTITAFKVENGWAASGDLSLRMTATSVPNNAEVFTEAGLLPLLPVEAGQAYSAGFTCNMQNGNGTPFLTLLWFDATKTLISNTAAGGAQASGVQSVKLENQFAPSSAVYLTVAVAWFNASGSTATMDGYLDDVMLAQSPSLPAYFDGDSPICGWVSTPGASMSQSPGVAGQFLITMSLPVSQQQTGLTILSQLANMGYLCGIDYGCDYFYKGSEPQVQITISYPRRGVALNPSSKILDVSGALEFEYDEDGTQQANNILAAISGTGAVSTQAVPYNNFTPDSGNYPAFDQAFQNPASSSAGLSFAALSSLVTGALDLYAYPVKLPVVTMPLFDKYTGLRQDNVGDDVILTVPKTTGRANRRFPNGLSAPFRIIRADYSIPDDDIPTVVLSLNEPPGHLDIAPLTQVVTVPFTGPGTYTWVCPFGVTSIAVVATGAGGGGSNTNGVGSTVGGNGGGGGETASEPALTVVPGDTYIVVVGAGGPGGIDGGHAGTNGGNSTMVVGAITVTAHGGHGGSTGSSGGPGGTGSTNTTHFNGGAGGAGGPTGGPGGGGGSSAGPTSAGNAGAAGTANGPGAGAAAVAGGGIGGDGGATTDTEDGPGDPGGDPGAGGGGGFATGTGGVGGDGQVLIMFTQTA